MGGIAGAVIAGPHLREWAILKSMGAVLGCFSLGGFLGYGAAALVIGSQMSPGIALGSGESEGDSGSVGDGSDGGGDS